MNGTDGKSPRPRCSKAWTPRRHGRCRRAVWCDAGAGDVAEMHLHAAARSEQDHEPRFDDDPARLSRRAVAGESGRYLATAHRVIALIACLPQAATHLAQFAIRVTKAALTVPCASAADAAGCGSAPGTRSLGRSSRPAMRQDRAARGLWRAVAASIDPAARRKAATRAAGPLVQPPFGAPRVPTLQSCPRSHAPSRVQIPSLCVAADCTAPHVPGARSVIIFAAPCVLRKCAGDLHRVAHVRSS